MDLFKKLIEEVSRNPSPTYVENLPQGRAIDEVISVGTSLVADGWKHIPPSPVELALGYVSYFHWKYNGEFYTGDPRHFSFPNDSARKMALLTVSQAQLSRPLLNAIRKLHTDFDPALELALAEAKPSRNHPIWGECVTRATILICRSLAYADSEVVGTKHMGFMDLFDREQLRLLGINLSEPPLGKQATSFLFGNY